MDTNTRVKMIEQTLQVITKEFNEYNAELQLTIQTLTQMVTVALKTHGVEIEDLKRRLGVLATHIGAAEPAPQVSDEDADETPRQDPPAGGGL